MALALATPARAADIEPAPQPPNKPPPSIYSPIPAQNWSGLSVGIFGGGGIGRSGQSYVDGTFSTDDYQVKGALLDARHAVANDAERLRQLNEGLKNLGLDG